MIDHQSQQFQKMHRMQSWVPIQVWLVNQLLTSCRMTTHIATSFGNVFLSFQNQTELSKRCLTESGWKAWPEMCSLIHRMTSKQGNILLRLLPPLTPNNISPFTKVGVDSEKSGWGASHQCKNWAVKVWPTRGRPRVGIKCQFPRFTNFLHKNKYSRFNISGPQSAEA